ncbi:hypothetical protein [Actinoplanes siamensis]|uniref:LPXTG-motif cell wall-anchored protein n=1 Tax=Actinoplanes siamensis TaxID=1223317 RepID=A0A919N3R4_9ACTN|nr:hypothetical protein [Actinoplanes siamensis]GIF03794.1 hypothetical protein Asi03nite_13320 [Actinoplanes siamensis]
MSLLVASLTAIVISAPVAHAAPYPAEPPAAAVSSGIVEPGGSVTFSGGGFLPRERITITVSYGASDNEAAYRPAAGAGGGFVPVARQLSLHTNADDNGDFRISVPLAEAGTATLTATGQTSGVTATSTVEVTQEASAPAEPPGQALPTTGPAGHSALITMAGGLGAVAVGALLIWVARARRREV